MTQPRVTNNAGIDLSAAVWLAHDDYDYVPAEKLISVTTLIKPIRQIILAARIPEEQKVIDIVDVIKARFGQALHRDIEWTWVNHYISSLKKLGFPDRVAQAVRINPTVVEPDTIPVWTEQRAEKQIGGWTVSGKIDLIIDYRLRDVKSTSVYGYQNRKGIDTTWKLQGSIYRWLNPEKVEHDEFLVQYLLLDWANAGASRDPNYPPHACPNRTVQLLSVKETEKFIADKLALLDSLADAPEEMLPECTEEDLWRTEPTYKYFANADAPPGQRSTKNFDNLVDAMAHKNEKGKGRVDVVPGQVKACTYCPAFALCGQKDRLIAEGSLILNQTP